MSIVNGLTGVSEELVASASIVFYKVGAVWKERAAIALFWDCHENGYNMALEKLCYSSPVDTASCLRTL